MKTNVEYTIYVDTGGTFSDAIIVSSDGTYYIGKTPTTPEQLEECFFESINDAASKMGRSLEEVLSEARVIGYGTTQGTNIVVTGAGAPNLGLLTTYGHEDRSIIMRQRAAGLSRLEGMRIARADKPEPLIPRQRIRGAIERIDCFGNVVIPLNEDSVIRAIKELISKGVEGIAVVYLWSFLSPQHERRTKEIINQIAPDLPVSLSSEVSPIIREYPRIMTTIIDLYIGKALRELLGKMEERLMKQGYRYPLLVMQASGGLSRSDTVKPANTLHSGPVGGLMGVEYLKKVYGFENAIGTDVGGTSFDITFSPKEGSQYLREPIVGRFEISNPMLEITTIGAGGGTTAWIDNITGGLRVGPYSAGSVPGPVCYARGGTQPTVTDADVVMGRIDSKRFLRGKGTIDKELAWKAIEEKIASPLKMEVPEAAEAICRIIDGKMQATLSTLVATKGINPKNCVLFAFGGMGPGHCAGYAHNLGFNKIIIPSTAAVFSAYGAATSDVRHRYEGSAMVYLTDLPYNSINLSFNLHEGNWKEFNEETQNQLVKFNKMFQEIEGRANSDMIAEGYKLEDIEKVYQIMARYGGQLWEIRVNIPISIIKNFEDLQLIIHSFEEEYIKVYGKEAMLPRGGLQIMSVAVEASAFQSKPIFTKSNLLKNDSSEALIETRQVYFNGKFTQSTIYDFNLLEAGNLVLGPSIIEAGETTIVIPPEWKATIDIYHNVELEQLN